MHPFLLISVFGFWNTVLYICPSSIKKQYTMNNGKSNNLIKAMPLDGGIVEELPNGELSTLQNAVGGYVEAIYLGNLVMWVNEEGLLQGLPENIAASTIAGQRIVGDVVIEQAK